MTKIYTTKTCAYCILVKKFLDRKGHQYEVVDLDDNPAKRQELLDKTGAMTVPITEINDQFIVGWNPSLLAAAIANS